MRQTQFFVAALLLAAPALAFGGRKSSSSDDSSAPQGTALIEELKNSNVDKKRFETYVKRRLAKIDQNSKARMDFMTKEAATWTTFWTKVHDDRRLFEIRLSRQTLDFFESLSSISNGDRDTAVADFEKLQGNVISAFEAQQKQKLDDFFAQRDQRWKDFVVRQEQERTKFLADAPADWQRTGLAVGATADRGEADQAKDAPNDAGQ